MRSLEEHNDRMKKYYFDTLMPRYTDISCPKCGSELLDNYPYKVVEVSPPRMRVYCRECNWEGFRLG